MKKYVYNFDQKYVLKIHKDDLSLNMDDLLIMNYIIDMFVSDGCEHIVKNDKTYVWVNRSKLLEDLPILDISEHRLSTILAKLEKLELIERKNVKLVNQGSKTYIFITDITLSMLETNYLNKVLDMINTLRDDKNVTSDNIYNSNIYNYYSNNINNISGVTKMSSQEKKLSLPKQCMLETELRFVNNPDLVKVLNDYLFVRLSIKDKPLTYGVNSWKNMLNNLMTLSGDKVAIVKQSIDRKWAKFVELQTYNTKYTGTNVFGETNVHSLPNSIDERTQQEQWRKDNGIESF